MIKRTTFLARRPQLTPEQFRHHWQYVHGPIAARFPHLVGYAQNHVYHRFSHLGAPHYFLDGVVELWFEDAAAEAAGWDPEVTAALQQDEPSFLHGLTGARVTPSVHYPPSAYKALIVGRVRDAAECAERLRDLADQAYSALPQSSQVHVQQSEAGSHFTRRLLAVDEHPPSAAIIVCFGDSEPGVTEQEALKRLARSAGSSLAGVEVVLAREVRIV